MTDTLIKTPQNYPAIHEESVLTGFSMASDLQTGSLLRTLVTSKPNGSFLELGTGTGLSLAWIAEGMDSTSKVISIDNEERYIAIARKYFADDPRITLVCCDANLWINDNLTQKFDLIFADTWPGKYNAIEQVLSMLKVGGLYIIDDMLPQPNWPAGHATRVMNLIAYLENNAGFRLTAMNWSTGLIVAAKLK